MFNNFLSSFFLSIALLISSFVLAYQFPFGDAFVQDSDRSISVMAEGSLTVVPNIVDISIGTEVEWALTKEEAEEKINMNTAQIKTILLKEGISEEHIKVQEVKLTEKFVWISGKKTTDGFSATQHLNARVENIQDVSKIKSIFEQIIKLKILVEYIKASSSSDALVGKNEAFYEQARKIALNNVRKRADDIAQNMQVKIEAMQNVTESTKMEYSSGSFDENFSLGEIQYISKISASFSVK